MNQILDDETGIIFRGLDGLLYRAAYEPAWTGWSVHEIRTEYWAHCYDEADEERDRGWALAKDQPLDELISG